MIPDPMADFEANKILPTPVVTVVGPTASGKTDLAQQLALALHAEVVSADSMQIYKGMDIGTGKLPVHERLVPHWGFDLVLPGQEYSAALYQSYARRAFVDIEGRGRGVILCGGTGLYVRAALDDYDFPGGEQTENPTRIYYTNYAHEYGNEALWQLLKERDPQSAQVIHPNNVRRVVRAFELMDEGKSYAQQKANLQHISQTIPAIFFGVSYDRDKLISRIESRVDSMMEAGLVSEVEGLLNAGFRAGVTAPQAIGYKEIVKALDGACTMEQAVTDIKTATRRYAKRQRSWFKRDSRIVWLDGTDRPTAALLDECLSSMESGD